MYPRRVKSRLHPLWFKAFVTLVLTAFSLTAACSQTPSRFYLHDGDTVVFYGDSITEQLYYTHWVELYTATRFPHSKIRFFNAGVGGDRVSGGSAGPIDLRLSRDVLPFKPSVITIMLGMNDGNYRPLTPEIESTYTTGYQHILDTLKKDLPATRITLLGPSPYDELTRKPILTGYNTTMIRFSSVDKDLAAKNGLNFIDLNAPFNAALKRGVAINPLATQLLLPDRVHPEQLAHWFMAEAILKGWSAPAIVSSTAIDAAKKKVIATENTQVTNLTGDQRSITWTQLDGALPLPLDDKSAATSFLLKITDLEQALNQQPLKVTGLKPGLYALSIDGALQGKVSAQQLAQGINLASYPTPMRGQAGTVRWLIRDRDDAHYVRLRMYVSEMKAGFTAQPAVDDISRFEDSLQQQIETASQPKPHTFRLQPASEVPSPDDQK